MCLHKIAAYFPAILVDKNRILLLAIRLGLILRADESLNGYWLLD